MPNWVSTIVEFSGEDENIQAVFKEISNEDSDDEDKYFDFNKLIPMPPSLNIESSSKGDLAYAYYTLKKFNEIPRKETHWLKSAQDIIDKVEKDITVSSQEMLELGKTLYENKEKYGATTWYEWCCYNWGTKWNACHVQVGDNTLYFATAWSFAAPVMDKLAELCKKHNVEFAGKWADEDMGSNTGSFESCNGELYCEYYTDCSPEAYSAYIECNGESDCLGVDKNGNCYRYDCNESCPNYKECMG